MAQTIGGQVGPTLAADNTYPPLRLGRMGDVIVSELHGRFYEQTYRGQAYSGGVATSALSANTITLTATTTPIIGVWNPPTSPVNLVILQAGLQVMINTLTTPTGGGAIVWASSVGNNALTLGSAGFNRKTLTAQGGYGKFYTPAIALTGLTTNLVINESADFINNTVLIHGTITAVSQQLSGGGVQNFDGSLIVPPGGVLCLLNTTSTTTTSVTSRILWEEVPL